MLTRAHRRKGRERKKERKKDARRGFGAVSLFLTNAETRFSFSFFPIFYARVKTKLSSTVGSFSFLLLVAHFIKFRAFFIEKTKRNCSVGRDSFTLFFYPKRNLSFFSRSFCPSGNIKTPCKPPFTYQILITRLYFGSSVN